MNANALKFTLDDKALATCDPPRVASNDIALVLEKMRATAAGAQGKAVEELTEEEKVAVCYVAGVPMKLYRAEEECRVVIGTDGPVGIYRSEGGFRVVVPPPPKRITFAQEVLPDSPFKPN